MHAFLYRSVTENLIFIDTHAHYYDPSFSEDAGKVIARARAAGVFKIIQPDTDSRERASLFSLSEQHPGVLYSMAGLYPGSVDENWEDEIADMMTYIPRGIVAIGEIGLDYHYSHDTAELQKRALRAQLELAAKLNLPVNVHLRDATEDFLEVLRECRHLGVRGNLHAYSGSWETFCELQRLGDWSVGIGGVLTFKKSKLPQAVARIPLEKILLETDAPYLTPAPYRGKRNESMYIPIIASKIAEIKGLELAEVAAVTTSNAVALFNL